MVDHHGYLISCVNSKFTHFPQWLRHFPSFFKFPTWTPSSLLLDDPVSSSTKKTEAVRRELSHFSMSNCIHLSRSANLFPVVSKDDLPDQLEANSQYMFNSPLLLLYQRFYFIFLVNFSSLCFYLHYPLIIPIQTCSNVPIIKIKLNTTSLYVTAFPSSYHISL